VDPDKAAYDPAKDRESVRGRMAMTLIWLLVGVIGASLLTVWVVRPEDGVEDLVEVLKLVFGPLVGLVGAVTGFYFGEKSGSGRG
jgi:hypothetical protein